MKDQVRSLYFTKIGTDHRGWSWKVLFAKPTSQCGPECSTSTRDFWCLFGVYNRSAV